MSAQIPPLVQQALVRYAEHHAPTGGMLRALLEGQSCMAVVPKMDAMSRAAIHEIVVFVFNALPGPAWGSPEKVAAWLKREGCVHCQVGAPHLEPGWEKMRGVVI